MVIHWTWWMASTAMPPRAGEAPVRPPPLKIRTKSSRRGGVPKQFPQSIFVVADLGRHFVASFTWVICFAEGTLDIVADWCCHLSMGWWNIGEVDRRQEAPKRTVGACLVLRGKPAP